MKRFQFELGDRVRVGAGGKARAACVACKHLPPATTHHYYQRVPYRSDTARPGGREGGLSDLRMVSKMNSLTFKGVLLSLSILGDAGVVVLEQQNQNA